MVEVVQIEEVADMCEYFFVVGEVEREFVSELPLVHAVVPVALDTADESVQDLAELEVRVHSAGNLSVEFLALVLL